MSADQTSRHQVRTQIHAKLLERLDLAALATLGPSQIRYELQTSVKTLLDEESIILPTREQEKLVDDILHEVTGLGPL
ncbi:MAG: hypothetical protein RLY56_1543, partial [Pseudomonadota bacterium]